MKQKAVMYAGIGAVIFGVIFFALHTQKTETKNDVLGSAESSTKEEQISGTFSGSMRDLVARNQSVKCTFTHSTEINSSSGTVFVSGGKVRGDFDITVPQTGTNLKAFMIADGKDTYVWSSILPQGFKMPISDAKMQSSGQPANGIDYNQSLDYECEPWSVDESVFITPTDISFVSMPTKAY